MLKAPASNRQKKVLRFFGVPFHETITAGAAGWELGTIFSDEANSERWRKYLFLTKDLDSNSDELVPYDAKKFEEIEIPEEWSASGAIQAFREEIVTQILASQSPYDTPQPDVVFQGNSFCFTGNFDFGPRNACEDLIREKRGKVAKGVSGALGYLVIGTQGSPDWKRGSYGIKIEQAIVLRREHGNPSIISEDHFFSFL